RPRAPPRGWPPARRPAAGDPAGGGARRGAAPPADERAARDARPRRQHRSSSRPRPEVRMSTVALPLPLAAPTAPGRLRATHLLFVKELRAAWRNRWFLLYPIAFPVPALGLCWLSAAGVAGTGYASLGRTAGSLVSLVLLVVPLMGLSLGAQSIAA